MKIASITSIIVLVLGMSTVFGQSSSSGIKELKASLHYELDQSEASTQEDVLTATVGIFLDITLDNVERYSSLEVLCLNRTTGYAKSFVVSIGKENGQNKYNVQGESFLVEGNRLRIVVKGDERTVETNLVRVLAKDALGNTLSEQQTEL